MVLLWLSLCISVVAGAQDTVQVVDFDATKNSRRGGLPYDQELKMRIRMPNAQQNYFVKLYAHKGKRSFTQSLRRDAAKGIVADYMARLDFEPTMVRSDSILTLHFKHEDRPPAGNFPARIFRPFNPNSTILKPGRKYSIIINRSEENNELVRLLQQSFDGRGAEIAGAKALYQVAFGNRFTDRSIQEISALNPAERDNIFSEYKAQVVPIDIEIANKITEFNQTIATKSATAVDPADIALSYQYFSGEKKLDFIRCIDTCTLDKIIKQLHNMKDFSPGGNNLVAMWKLVYFGKSALSGLSPQKTAVASMNLPADDYSELAGAVEEYMKAINSSVSSINQYIVFLTNLEIALSGKKDQAAITRLKLALIAENKELLDGAAKLKALGLQLKARDKIIVYSQRFASLTILDVNTHIYSFTTRNELMITPVFGYAYYGFQKGFNSFAPYLGFQINLQAMNKDIPFGLITEKTLLQRFSFTTAWTLTPVGDNAKRFDLFAGGSSLLTGLGFKLGHVVSLNTGAIWFKKANPNPVLPDRTTAITPFASISVNSEISKLLGDFTKLLPAR